MLKCELSSLEYKGDLVLEGLNFNDNLGYLLKFKKINTPSNSYCVDCEVYITIPRKKVTLNAFTYSFVNSTDMSFYDFVESVKGRVLNKFQGNVETIQKILDVYTIQNSKKTINIDTVYAKPKVELKQEDKVDETFVNSDKNDENEKNENGFDGFDGFKSFETVSLEDLSKLIFPKNLGINEFMSSKGVNLDDLFKSANSNNVEDTVSDKEDLEDEDKDKEDKAKSEEKESVGSDVFPELLKMFGFEPTKVKKVENADIEKVLKSGAEVLLNSLVQELDKINNKEPKFNNHTDEVKVNRHFNSETTSPKKSIYVKMGEEMYEWLKEAGYTRTRNEFVFIHYCKQYLYAAGLYNSNIANYLLNYCLKRYREEF